MGIEVTRKDIVWNYANLFLTTVVNIILLPVILQKLSSQEVGLWYVFTSFGSLATLIDFGISTSISRNVTFVWCGAENIPKEGYSINDYDLKPNYYLLFKLIKTSKAIYLILAFVVFVGLSTIGTLFIIASVKGQIPKNEFMAAWIVYLLSIVVNVYFAYWIPLLKGVGAVKESNQVVVIFKITQLSLTVVGLYLGYGLIAVSVAYFIGNLVMRLAAIWFFTKYKDVNKALNRFRKIKIPLQEKKDLFFNIWPNAYKQGLITLSSFIQKRASTLISSACLGLEMASAVGLTQQLFDLIMSVGNALFNAYLPAMSYERVNGNKKKLKGYFLKATGLSFYIIFFGGAVAILVSPFLLKFINSDTELLSINISFLLLIANLLINNHVLSGTYIATGNRVPMYKSYILTSVSAILLQLLFVTFTPSGVLGIILGGFFCNLAFNNWFWPLESSKDLGLTFKEYCTGLLSEPLKLIVDAPCSR